MWHLYVPDHFFFFLSPPFPAGVILLKAETRERIAILGVKSSRYLCMDLEGNPFSSVSQYSVSSRIAVFINLTDPL